MLGRPGASGADLARYVGSHPMAGRERSGAGHARGDLFDGRAWVVVPHDATDPAAVRWWHRLPRPTPARPCP